MPHTEQPKASQDLGCFDQKGWGTKKVEWKTKGCWKTAGPKGKRGEGTE